MQTIKLEIALTDERAAQVFGLLAQVLTAQSNDKPLTPTSEATPTPKTVPAPVASTPSPKAESKAVATVEAPKPVEEVKETPTPAQTESTLTVEQVREIAQKKIVAGKMPQVKELLTSFDSKSITALDSKHYAEFVEKVNAL